MMKYRIKEFRDGFNHRYYTVQCKYKWLPFWITKTEMCGFGAYMHIKFDTEENAKEYICLDIQSRAAGSYKCVNVKEHNGK